MCFLIALTLFSSSLLESAAVRYESPHQLNRRDDSNSSSNAHLAGGNYSCSGDEMCPPCFFCDLVCDEMKQTASVMNGDCATYDDDRGVTQIGACVFNNVKLKKDVSAPIYRSLPENNTSLNEMMCGWINEQSWSSLW